MLRYFTRKLFESNILPVVIKYKLHRVAGYPLAKVWSIGAGLRRIYPGPVAQNRIVGQLFIARVRGKF